MTNMKPYMKEWFDYLAAGKIMGRLCKKCGATEFPAYPICNECSSTDMEWVEMSGEGVLETFAYSAMGSYPYTEDDVMCGWFRLKEGMTFSGYLLDPPDSEELFEMMPVNVKAEVIKLDDEYGIHFPAFRIVK